MRAFLTLLSAVWRYTRDRRGRLLLYVAMFIGANIVLLLEPLVIGRLLNTIQQIRNVPDPMASLGILFALLIGIQFSFWALHGPARALETTGAFHARIAFADHVFRTVTSLPMQWHKDHHSGQTINRMRKSAYALNEFLGNGYQIIEMIVRLIGSVTAIVILQPIAAFIALSVTAFAFLIVFLFDRVLLRQYEEINEREHFTASALHDYVTNIATVITLRLESLTRNELWKRMTVYYPLFRRNSIVNETKWFLTTIVIAVMTVTVLAWYALTTIRGGGVLLAGTVYMLYDYLQKIGSVFFMFAWKYSATVQQYADMLASKAILDAVPAESDPAEPLPQGWRSVTIRNLRFSYEDTAKRRHHLDGISMTLERGKNIALVGESGSGKSTLMSLLRGLHVTESADVSCDGQTLPEGLRHLAQHVTLIPQEPEIFSNTIEYNVSVDTQQSEDELLHDIDLACFTPVLDRLPHGLKTDIAEKGVNLSGGEKQRLALARGIFAAKESDIILLDEPTSSVDSMNELKIHRNIFAHFADRCIVASIHRLHLLPLFDEVCVLANGKLIERGKPAELMERDGPLGRMWKQYLRQHPRYGK
ncbi:ABC transporter ATP-binding protein [Candidatus Peregrinibacteria bacterium]|nr:ABC transporter ATP-binding protein [Candidatus Peregrinibacteria bacterium]